jgi:sporulation protein YlmC with PRC-barrel domain
MVSTTITERPQVLSADTLKNEKVVNAAGENLGNIQDYMLDLDSGRIAYCVLSFGGFLGMGDKLFAIPWQAMKLDTANHCFILDVSKERLKSAPGFDKDHWPGTADREFQTRVYSYYNVPSYWE